MTSQATTTAHLNSRLARLAAERDIALARLIEAACDHGIGALIQIGSLGRGQGDAFSDLDLIAVPIRTHTPTDIGAAAFGDQILTTITVARNAPVGGDFRTICLETTDGVLWADLYARHEALWNRVEVKDLRHSVVAAAECSWGQSDLRSGREDGKQPRQSQDGLVSPDRPGLVRETGRCTRGTRVLKPLKRAHQLQTWRIWAGLRCASTGVAEWRTPWRPVNAKGEAMVNARGVAMARPQGHSGAPNRLNDSEVNVGTVHRRSCRWQPASTGIGALSAEGGGWGGGPVVVRAEESSVHGEGVQQIGSADAGMLGGRL
jgi:hypothetical protein